MTNNGVVKASGLLTACMICGVRHRDNLALYCVRPGIPYISLLILCRECAMPRLNGIRCMEISREKAAAAFQMYATGEIGT